MNLASIFSAEITEIFPKLLQVSCLHQNCALSGIASFCKQRQEGSVNNLVALPGTVETAYLKNFVVINRGAADERQQWDFGRFVQTVLYFNPPPTIESTLKSVFSFISPEAETKSMTETDQSMVVVTGATGGVGSGIVAALLAKGKSVRAIVRDQEKAKRLLADLPRSQGAQLEIVEGDITRPDTLTQNLFREASAVISATATIIAPKEGDTKDRDKYRQGIKFYKPTVSGASPREVEYEGVQNLLHAAKPQLAKGHLVFDARSQGDLSQWGALDDVVMGGTSVSSFKRSESGDYAVFSGRVSATNNGGFASVRTKNFSPFLDLSSCTALRLRVKGDGQRYKVSVRTDANWDGIGYTQSFDTRKDEWQDVDLLFEDFTPVFRAKTKADAPKFQASSVASIQLMLSKFEYDGKLNPAFRLGEFELPIEKIEGVLKKRNATKFVHVSSAGVTRPGRPGLDLEKEPPAVRMNDELGGLLTWKLAGEDAIRESGLPYTIVRPVALTDEPAGADLELAQGDNIKGKISRADIADLCAALIMQPLAVNTTLEIKSTVPFSQPFSPIGPVADRDWNNLFRAARLEPDSQI